MQNAHIETAAMAAIRSKSVIIYNQIVSDGGNLQKESKADIDFWCSEWVSLLLGLEEWSHNATDFFSKDIYKGMFDKIK